MNELIILERRAPGEDVLTVFRDPVGADASRWAGLVADLGHALGLRPVDTPLDMTGEGWVGRLVAAAAAAPGPVLVVPRPQPEDVETPVATQLLRVVIASDDAPDVVRSARFLSRHLRNGGVQTSVLVVLSGAPLPAMWEGPGHNAAAWRDELHRRHGEPDALEVLPGTDGPGRAIGQHTDDAQLLVLIWRRVAAEGRAVVVRSVLDDAPSLPCLLVPIAWVEALRHRAGGETGAGPPRGLVPVPG